ncbi:MAG: M28 family peptidase [Chloroflexi bacterium]|nr:M28 family peptidase [Chloroflexota bacterium]
MRDVHTLSEPRFMGRHTGTPGELLGAQYLASELSAAGVDAAGDGAGYLQRFPMTVQELGAVPLLELRDATGRRVRLRLRDDFRPIVSGPAGAGDVTGPVVFGGSGADLAGVDLAGKLLLVVPRGSLLEIANRARAAGALGLLVATGRTQLLKAEARVPDPGAIPMAELSQVGTAALLEGSGRSREDLNALIQSGQPLPAFDLPWTARLAVFLAPPAAVNAINVVGVIRAATPTSRSIVLGAHYEEIGPDPDGVVFPAANDNASGTAVVLEVARLLAAGGARPAVNVVFAFWSGHEEGLFGSRHYVASPPFPAAETELYVNVDTVGAGSGNALSVGASAGTARQLFAEALARLRAQPEPFPIEPSGRFGGGSDDVHFARSGVPVIAMAWSGVFGGPGTIHTPADAADLVDPAKVRVPGVLTALLALLAAER